MHQAVQFLLDQIDLVDDPVLRAELLLTLRDTTDSGFKRGRRKVCYEMKADRWRLVDIEDVVHMDRRWITADIVSYAEENDLPIPKRCPVPESVWRPHLALGNKHLRSSVESTPTTS